MCRPCLLAPRLNPPLRSRGMGCATGLESHHRVSRCAPSIHTVETTAGSVMKMMYCSLLRRASLDCSDHFPPIRSSCARSKGSSMRSLRHICLLYTSDAADDLLCVDLGGRRIIKIKTT